MGFHADMWVWGLLALSVLCNIMTVDLVPHKTNTPHPPDLSEAMLERCVSDMETLIEDHNKYNDPKTCNSSTELQADGKMTAMAMAIVQFREVGVPENQLTILKNAYTRHKSIYLAEGGRMNRISM